ncbi:MAG: RtcB family protein [Clostridia bacterium]|nr:RtcB family protein [Clostridia bacterium]
MIEIKGRYAEANVFTDTLEPSAESMIKAFCDQPASEGARIRIMPDVHAGKGSTIGTTMTIHDKIVPNVVGVDIGCGMLTVKLSEKRIDLPKLDSFIRQNIPCGFEVRERSHRSHGRLDIYDLRCVKKIDIRRAKESIGTLGGGNHFIEIDRDDEDNLYLVIHTGSRNLGLRVAEHYQKKAYGACGGRGQDEIPYELSYLSGDDMRDYLHDMEFMQAFAHLNRTVIKEVILDGMKLTEEKSFSTVHNYVDVGAMILRKGAVSAKKGERLLIPMNMRDGSLICTGLGNEEWNFSAPHGAGRLMSRKDALDSFTLTAYKESMEGIFTTSVTRDTIDECPMVYKPMEEIIKNIGDTVVIEKIIKPIYNFKASENAGRRKRKTE